MAPRLESIHLDEYLNLAYLCPDCRAQMTSGLQLPDAEEWIVFPHCSECNYEGSDLKRPYKDCIPAEYRREVFKMGAFIAPAMAHEATDVAHVSLSAYSELPVSGPGTWFIGFLPLCEVVRNLDESDGDFWGRAHMEAWQKMESTDGLVEIGRASVRIMEDPAFYRF